MEYESHGSLEIHKSIGIVGGAAAGATTVGEIIDTVGYESLEYVVISGTITTGDFSVLLEEAEDDPDNPGTPLAFTTVPAELQIGADMAFASGNDGTIRRQGVVAKGRFQRLTLVGTNTPVGDFTAMAILGHAHTEPTPNLNP